jgi:hypothetical protein
VTASAAHADSFSFAVSGVGFTGSGVLTGSSLGGGLTNVTGGTFTINGVAATIVADPTAGQMAGTLPAGRAISSTTMTSFTAMARPSSTPAACSLTPMAL